MPHTAPSRLADYRSALQRHSDGCDSHAQYMDSCWRTPCLSPFSCTMHCLKWLYLILTLASGIRAGRALRPDTIYPRSQLHRRFVRDDPISKPYRRQDTIGYDMFNITAVRCNLSRPSARADIALISHWSRATCRMTRFLKPARRATRTRPARIGGSFRSIWTIAVVHGRFV